MAIVQRTLKTANLWASIAIASLAFLVGCAESEAPAEPTTPPNILVISMDTMGANHMACYGYSIPNTPFLGEFAESADLWENCYSTAPWTLPAHASMFTGLYPTQHGAHSFKVTREMRNVNPLPMDNTTLAEVVSELGYQTGAFIANKHYLNGSFNVGQGFDTFHVFRSGDIARADLVNRKVKEWLEPERQQPFFLFINYMDTHRPYRSEEREGMFDFPVERNSGQILNRLMPFVLTGKGDEHLDELKQLSAQYDTAIANLDEKLRELFAHLESKGLLENTLVILTSDHGEYLGEHDLLEHSKDVYQEALHVPLIVRHPGQTVGKRIGSPTTVAMLPTIVFDHLPADMKSTAFSKIPRLDISKGFVAENYYSRSRDLFGREWGDRLNRVRHAFFADGWKYIHSSDGKHELYNLPEDPHELSNQIDHEPERAREMLALLEGHLVDPREANIEDLPEYTEEDLQIIDELGY